MGSGGLKIKDKELRVKGEVFTLLKRPPIKVY